MNPISAATTSAAAYPYALLVFGCACLLAAAWAWRALRPETKAVWEKLPRNVLFGMALGAVDLAWCVPHAEPVFSPGSWTWLVPLACILLVVAFWLLDYHFARAFAGFLILLSHYFLLESFAAHTPVRWFFASLCVTMGTAGVFIGGMPYLLREVVRRGCDRHVWRGGLTGVLAVYAFTCLALGVWHFVR